MRKRRSRRFDRREHSRKNAGASSPAESDRPSRAERLDHDRQLQKRLQSQRSQALVHDPDRSNERDSAKVVDIHRRARVEVVPGASKARTDGSRDRRGDAAVVVDADETVLRVEDVEGHAVDEKRARSRHETNSKCRAWSDVQGPPLVRRWGTGYGGLGADESLRLASTAM